MTSPRTSVTTGRDSPNPTFNEPFQFDEHKFSNYAANPEKQELYVFNWLSNLERELKKTDRVFASFHELNLWIVNYYFQIFTFLFE